MTTTGFSDAAWVVGEDRCGPRLDGSVGTQSAWCWLWCGALVGLAFWDCLTAAGKIAEGEAHQWHRVALLPAMLALSSFALAVLFVWIAWHHCLRCNGLAGYGLVALVGALWHVFLVTVLPLCEGGRDPLSSRREP